MPENLIVTVGSDLDNVRVTTGNNQTDTRQRDLRMRQKVRVNMPFDMVHADERFFQRISQPLGCAQANQERTDQPRPHSHSDGVELCKAVAAFCQRFFYDNINVFQMLARCHLRHHAAKFFMDLDLRRNHIRADLMAIADHRTGCFITAGFNGQDHTFQFIHFSSSIPS